MSCTGLDVSCTGLEVEDRSARPPANPRAPASSAVALPRVVKAKMCIEEDLAKVARQARIANENANPSPWGLEALRCAVGARDHKGQDGV